jgi:hypothetical protein
MKTPDKSPLDYPHQVLESTRQYVAKLLDENGSLRRQLASFEDEQYRLRQQIQELRMQADSRQVEQQRLTTEKQRIESESQEQAERFADIEKQNGDLANLYVASYQLHGTVDRNEVLQAIKEIVINLIGSEEFGIYEQEHDEISLIDGFGNRAGETPIREILERGLDRSLEGSAVLVAVGSEPEEAPLVCVPLRLGSSVVGAIVIFELLAHKAGLEHIDFELFDLLAAHAAPALYLAELHAGRQLEDTEVSSN